MTGRDRDTGLAAELLTTTAAAKLLHVTRRTLTRWLAAGRVRAIRIEGRNYYRRDELEAMATKAHQGAAGVNLHMTEAEAGNLLSMLDGHDLDAALAEQLAGQLRAQITEQGGGDGNQ